MKLLILIAAFALTKAAKLDKTYLPPHSQSSGGAGSILQTPLLDSGNQAFADQNGNFGRNSDVYTQNGNGFGSEYSRNIGYERPRAALERNAAILRQDNSNDGETYSYAYETENGIYAEENGVATNGVEAQGGFGYTDDDGKLYSIRYTAGQNGFVPEGDHLPTSPPIPEEILKALEQNARDEAAGIYDDGSYSEAKYGDEERRNDVYQYGNTNTATGISNKDDTVITNAAIRNSGTYSRPETRYSTPAGLKTQATFSNNLEKAYLPPFERQRGFGRGRQSYNTRNGYRY